MAATGYEVRATWADRVRGAQPYVWILPALVLFATFVLVPAGYGLWLSVTSWDGTGSPAFNGLDNYVRAFQDSGYWSAITNTIVYAVGSVAGKIALALGLALVMNQRLPARAVFRTALFMPVVLSFVVVGLLWSWIYRSDLGLLNNVLGAIGLDGLQQDWLGNPDTAMLALIIVDIWKWFGFHMVIFLAGLQSIPGELYEAGRIDGAGPWRLFWSITMPLIIPITLINAVLAAAGAFNVFDIVYVMTQGGPVGATNVAMMEIYKQAFQFYQFGYASALAVVQLAIVSAISVAIILVMRRQGSVLGVEHG